MVGKRIKIGWLVSFPVKGSGGQRTIYQNIGALSNKGYECEVFLENIQGFSFIKTEKMVEDFFGQVEAKIYPGWEVKGKFDLLFATFWKTAKIVRDYPYSWKKAYFIQDFEPYFYPMGDDFLFVENTYKYGLYPITIGKWLAKKMQDDYNAPSQYFDFCADLGIYKNNCQRREPLSVCMIYQPEKPRRCSMLGIEALWIVKNLMPEVKVYIYGSKVRGDIWFEHENLNVITPKECAELYNKCSVGLCISSSNPSRIPFEMMACGLPVVDIFRENNLYCMPDNAVLLAEPTPESIAGAIISIIKDSEKHKKMSLAGQKFMQYRNLEFGYSQFIEAVENILEKDKIPQQIIERRYCKEIFIADNLKSESFFRPKGSISLGQQIKRFVLTLLIKLARWLKK